MVGVVKLKSLRGLIVRREASRFHPAPKAASDHGLPLVEEDPVRASPTCVGLMPSPPLGVFDSLRKIVKPIGQFGQLALQGFDAVSQVARWTGPGWVLGKQSLPSGRIRLPGSCPYGRGPVP